MYTFVKPGQSSSSSSPKKPASNLPPQPITGMSPPTPKEPATSSPPSTPSAHTGSRSSGSGSGSGSPPSPKPKPRQLKTLKYPPPVSAASVVQVAASKSGSGSGSGILVPLPAIPSNAHKIEPDGPPTPRTEDSLLLEELDKNLFRCDPAHLWRPVGARGVFGGQIIGLSLVAATNTVPRTHKVHSLHSYFLLGGDNSRAILFRVEDMRDSRSFVTRQVTAQQNGRPIFVLICSFMRPEDTPLQHQYTMPVAPAPESLPSREQMMESWIQQTPKKYHESIRERLEEPIPIDMRPCEPLSPVDYMYPIRKEPRQLVWMKSKTGLPADPAFHMCVAAYCSDHHLLWTTLRPHAVTGVTNPSLGMLVSLDHSMWYHSDFRADEWLLYEMESPRVSAGRGMALGRLWTRDGKLAVTIAQEGLIRANMNPEKPLTVGFGRVPPKKEQEGEPKPGRSKL